MNNGRASNFISGFFIGGIIGSTIAFLYTPIKGKKLRKIIAQKTNDVVEDVNDYYHTGKDKVTDVYKNSIKKADHILVAAKKMVA
ncbi:MAG: YtxH domain-containing protein [Syntrophothermus sp.]|nr:YtxH domain-containing protein [Ignavibacteriaceae bacterium]